MVAFEHPHPHGALAPTAHLELPFFDDAHRALANGLVAWSREQQVDEQQLAQAPVHRHRLRALARQPPHQRDEGQQQRDADDEQQPVVDVAAELAPEPGYQAVIGLGARAQQRRAGADQLHHADHQRRQPQHDAGFGEAGEQPVQSCHAGSAAEMTPPPRHTSPS